MVFIINNEEDAIKVRELLKEKEISNKEHLSPLMAYLADECDTAMENILSNAKEFEVDELQSKYNASKCSIVSDLLECSIDLDGLFETVYDMVKVEVLD